MIEHVRSITAISERARMFNNERFWFDNWEAKAVMIDTLFVKMKEEVLPNVIKGEDGKVDVKIAEEEAELDATFDKSFEELLAEMKTADMPREGGGGGASSSGVRTGTGGCQDIEGID